MTTSGTLITMNNSLTSIIKKADDGGSIISGGAIKIDGTNPSIRTLGILLTFNLSVNFFCKLYKNYKGFQTKKLQNIHKFQCNLHENS
jgi:hypothetical protein